MRDKKSRGAGTNTPTTQAYTGQKRESSFRLYDYNARWYDFTCDVYASHDASACNASALGRFTQADTIVPNPASAKAFDRYAYVENNPVRYNDPSGHDPLTDPSWLARFGSNQPTQVDVLLRLYSLAYPEEWFKYQSSFYNQDGKINIDAMQIIFTGLEYMANRNWDGVPIALE